jgi:secreted PhoX family phosphatase
VQSPAPATQVTVSTLAGKALKAGSTDGPKENALFDDPHGVAIGSDGTVYVSEAGNQLLRQITPKGIVQRLAGLPKQKGGVDGEGDQARFFLPNSLTIDRQGNLYVADLGNQAIRKITPKGVVTTLAGKLGAIGYADGPGAQARFSRPHGIEVVSDGTVYVADAMNHVIRKITPAGVVSTVAGKAMEAGAVDGPGAKARFFMPYAITVDSKGNMYVADRGNNAIRKVTPDGVVSTLAGKLLAEGHADGPGSEARFSSPRGITIDATGNLFVADYDSCLIRRITPDGFVTTIAGKAGEAGSSDGPGSEARFNGPHGVAVDRKGRLFVADSDNHLIRMLTIIQE